MCFRLLNFKEEENKNVQKSRTRNLTQGEPDSSQSSLLVVEVSKGYAQPRNRIYRGLCKDKDRIFHADVVGAYNILCKAVNAQLSFRKPTPVKVSV